MYAVTIAGNVEECRTEAEISIESGGRVAIVYEDLDGWHTDILEPRLLQPGDDLQTVIGSAKEMLSHYVNRRGENAPESTTRGAFALWLMAKDDGTAMGMNMRNNTNS
jgi:hypothetical protein